MYEEVKAEEDRSPRPYFEVIGSYLEEVSYLLVVSYLDVGSYFELVKVSYLELPKGSVVLYLDDVSALYREGESPPSVEYDWADLRL